jgi:peptidoglycan/LPS O-acetylase OafA/YrhL
MRRTTAMRAEAGERRSRYQQLDGLRGAAALTVVFAHFVIAFHPSLLVADPVNRVVSRGGWISQTPLTVFWSPELAVAMFFVLSGFVLAASVSGRSVFLGELTLRRWVRLSGPILLTSLVIWLLVGMHLIYSGTFAAENGSEWLKMNFSEVARHGNDVRLVVFESLFDIFARGIHWWNSVLWTMRVEFLGSIGLFCAYEIVGRFNRSAWINLAVAVAVLALTWQTNYGSFAAGAALFEISRCTADGVARPVLIWFGGLALLLAGLLAGGMPYDPFGTPYWPTTVWLFSTGVANPVLSVHRFGAALIVAAALLWLPLRRLLMWRVFRYLGRISFAMYLCHPVVICSLAAWMMLRLDAGLGYDAASVVVLPVFIAVLIGVAEVATRAFDEPSVRLARDVGRAATRLALELLPTGLSRGLVVPALQRS